MYSDYMSWGWGGMILGPLVMLAFFGLFITFIVLVVKWAAGLGTDNSARQRTSLDILEERYAAGEIDREEFEEKRKILRR